MNINLFLFIFFLSLLLSPTFSAPCTSENCKIENNCRCASKTIPGGLNRADIPQFVVFTLDDSIYERQYELVQHVDFLLKNPNIKDALGCNMKLSYYVRQIETDFHIVNYVDKIGAINLHSFAHNSSVSSSHEEWLEEFATNKYNLNRLAEVPYERMRGARAPFLQFNDEYFEALKELGITYDSSFFYSDPVSKTPYWPFTLDYDVPESVDFCHYGACPKQAHAGFWEFPMTNFDYDIAGNVMDPVTDENTAAAMLEKFKNNFQDSYNSNKAPRGFYLHWRYFTVGYFESLNEVHINLIVDFYTWLVTTYNDIVFATESEIIEWIKHPVSLQEIKNNKALSWKCPDITLTLQTVCPNSVKCYPNDNEPFSICGNNNVCPAGNIYPGLDPSLVSIMTITTTSSTSNSQTTSATSSATQTSISTSTQTQTSSTTTTSTSTSSSTSTEITPEITTSLPTTTSIPTTTTITSTETTSEFTTSLPSPTTTTTSSTLTTETTSEITKSLPTQTPSTTPTTTTSTAETKSEITTSLPTPTPSTTPTITTSTTETSSIITTSLPTSTTTKITSTTETTSVIATSLPTPTPTTTLATTTSTTEGTSEIKASLPTSTTASTTITSTTETTSVIATSLPTPTTTTTLATTTSTTEATSEIKASLPTSTTATTTITSTRETTSVIATSLPTPTTTTTTITSTTETTSVITTSLPIPTTTLTTTTEATSVIIASLQTPTTTASTITSATETTSVVTTSAPTSTLTPTTPTTDTTSTIVENLPTPTPTPTDLSQGGSWVGSVMITTTVSENILCLDKIQVQHDKDAVGKAFILTINFCSSMIKAIDHIFGYSYTRIEENGFLQIKMGGSGVYFKKDVSYTVGSICVVLTDTYRNTFKISNDVSWGLDIYDDSLSCTLKNCPLFCGNGVCDANEAESTCPADCGTKVNCQRSLRRN